jgi:diaminohydroxyphosphoribosylaminopyrimidine deaminase/5-amino-6-(5-phosphoribosylamino)uracil reductase
VLRDLGRRGITSVLIEGGAEILNQAFALRLVDRVHFYIAPLILGGPKLLRVNLAEIDNAQCHRIGPDILLTGDVRYPAKKD